MKNVGFLEGVFLLILAYLILSRGQAFSAAIKAIGGVFADSTRALQGR